MIRQAGSQYSVRHNAEEWAVFEAPALNEDTPAAVTVSEVDELWTHVRVRWDAGGAVTRDELSIPFHVQIPAGFWWAPHLAPEEGNCIAQHVFRSPALIAARGGDTLVVVPDLDLCGRQKQGEWFLDYDAPAQRIWLGLTRTRVSAHVLYQKTPGLVLGPGAIELGFFVAAYRDEAPVSNPWAKVTDFLWRRYGHPRFEAGEPGTTPMDRYVEYTYSWAFDTWREPLWQEFELDGKTVGGPAFIVNVTESPNYTGPVDLREYLSVWNQAWFSTLRAAGGIRRYGVRTGNTELVRRADQVKEFSLAAPMRDGIFPSVYRTEMEPVDAGGGKVQRSKGWGTGYWTNSDRSPVERGITARWYHVLDASWTCLLMLRWNDELDADPRLVHYAVAYAEKLLRLQRGDGFFPAWLDPDTLAPSEVLAVSPETSMSVTFLLKLHEETGDARYREAALRAMDAVLAKIVPIGRWEDFETYWSCCPWGKDEYLGRPIPRNAMYKQCNFSVFWTAEALLAAYKTTGEERYLAWGRRTLDELAMTQQVWQPPYIYVPALGGFGVMNCDGEWNDSRQCLFAELFLDYYRVQGDPQLFERGIAALKSAFVMMYCPENARQKVLWEKVWPFFGPEDYGFMMENYGHGGATTAEGEGIGNFTIFTWGNGAASESRNRIRDHYGDVYIDRTRGCGFGIDSIRVEKKNGNFVLTDLADSPREVLVVFDGNTRRTVHLAGSTVVSP